jgi:hypothetical protein
MVRLTDLKVGKMVHHPLNLSIISLLLTFVVLGCGHDDLHKELITPPISDQDTIVKNSKYYTTQWLVGNFEKASNLISPSSSFYMDRSGNAALPRDQMVRKLEQLRHQFNKVSDHDTVSNIQILPERYTVLGLFFVVLLNQNSLKNDLGVHLLSGDTAEIQFKLKNQTFYQLWVRDTNEKKWKCINAPLQIDQRTYEYFKRRAAR